MPNIQALKENLEANIDQAVADFIDALADNVPYVGMAWSMDEHDDPEEVLEGCLLVVCDTHEEAHDQLLEQIRLIGGSGYHMVIRRAK